MKLKNLLFSAGIKCPEKLGEITIEGINYDSRKIKKNEVFVCLEGENTDGHIFAGDASLRGAALIIAERALEVDGTPTVVVPDTRKALSAVSKNYYGNPGESITMYGVTGTNGKTTVSYLIKSGIEASGEACGLIGTISYKIGDKDHEAERTTPESLDVQRLFSDLKDQGIRNCVMEASSHALQLGRVQDVSFDYSIFTNLSLDHMDFHKDEEEYYLSKKTLFEQTSKMGIINIDDRSGARLAGEIIESGKDVRTFSMKDDKADYLGRTEWMNENGCCMYFLYKNREVGRVESSLTGEFSLYNILASAACLHSAGIPWEAIAEGIKKVKVVPGRFEAVKNDKGIAAFIDFAHTPEALKNVLSTAGDLSKGRVICVFGCGGDRDRTKRPFMGKIAGAYADYCILTSDNPRNENVQTILDDVEEGLYESGCIYEIIEDRRDAIRRAVEIYEKGDIIIVAGKGHEDYQIIGGAKNYFSDRNVLREMIDKGEKRHERD
jgi:UDP-N-acetylmuramoyl-L-alanyl-D-glutamate--2,6-diaminopimelate ligase